MSKHTNKVHGKLNFLIATVVVAIGAVSYLLVQTGAIDPSMGTSSGIRGVEKAQKNVSNNEVVVELEGEEIQEVLNNPDFQRMIQSGEFQKLASDPDFVKVLDKKDGIGIMGDIFRSLEDDYVDIKAKKRGDDKIQANMSNDVSRRGAQTRGSGLSSGDRVIGNVGNPANNDSGISGEGGATLILAVNTIANKVSGFQKFMKGAEFQKFMKDARFQKFMKSGADFQKFQKDAAFQKFMKGADFQKFMKGAQLKFMKDAQLQKFMKGADLQKFMKGSDFEKFAKSSAFQKFAKNQDFAKFMMRGDFQKFMKSSAYAKGSNF